MSFEAPTLFDTVRSLSSLVGILGWKMLIRTDPHSLVAGTQLLRWVAPPSEENLPGPPARRRVVSGARER